MTTPSTSHHSAFSELMIQNAELREQLRVLQSAYDSLSQMKEKSVASRIELDELKEENANMKNDLALLAKYFDKQWPKDVHETIERLKAENARLKEELEAARKRIAELVRFNENPSQYHEGLEHELERLEAENARLAATINAIADLSKNTRAPSEAQIMKAIEYALGATENSTALADLLAPTIEALEAALVVGFDRAIVRKELARLRGLVERKP